MYKVLGEGLVFYYFLTTPFSMKFIHDFSFITIFFVNFTYAIALVKIRRKMVILEKFFVNFIKSGVIIDTNHH